MGIDIKLSRPCEDSGNISDNVMQLLCILDKKQHNQMSIQGNK